MRFLELGDAGPLIIALHGKGSTPEQLAEHFAGLPARVLLPEGFERVEHGRAWYPWPASDLAAVISAAEEKLWPAIRERAAGQKLIVTGFSQGAVLAFLIAARHPDEVLEAVPIAGGLPRALQPRTRGAPVYALHGSDDASISVKSGRVTVDAFAAAGGQAELRVFPGVGHTFASELREALWARIASVSK